MLPLDIMLPLDNIEAVFPTALKLYGSQSGLICHGDGERAQRRVEGSNDWQEITCPYKECEHYIQGHCKEVGNLQVILPKIKGMLGIYQIDTSSYNSILNIKSGLEMLKRTVGRCSLIPLILEVRMQEANPLTAEGKRLKALVPVMHLRLDHTFYDVIEMARERKLIKQVKLSSPEIIEIDNPDIDDKPELLYPDNIENKEVRDQDIDPGNEDKGNKQEDDPLIHKLHEAWDILGTPEGKRKAILGKPHLNKKELLKQLNAEIDQRAVINDIKQEQQQSLFF